MIEPQHQRQPDGYAYRYADGLRFETGGRSINGGRPLEVIGYYLAPTVEAMIHEALTHEVHVEAMYQDWGGES